MQIVGPGARDRVDDAAGRAAEPSRIRIGEYLKLKHGVDAQQDAAHRSWRLIVDIVDVRAIQQKTALLGPCAIDGNFGRASPDNIVAGRERGVHAALQQCELLKGAAVEREIANLLVVDKSAE